MPGGFFHWKVEKNHLTMAIAIDEVYSKLVFGVENVQEREKSTHALFSWFT